MSDLLPITSEQALDLVNECDARTEAMDRRFRYGSCDYWHALANAIMALGLVDAPVSRIGTGCSEKVWRDAQETKREQRIMIGKGLRADIDQGLLYVEDDGITLTTNHGRITIHWRGQLQEEWMRLLRMVRAFTTQETTA